MSETKNLKLFKHDEPLETNENKFDIDLALNQNWDKIEGFAEKVNNKVIELEDKNEEQDFNLQEQNTKLEEKIKKDRENMINLEVEGQSIHIEDSSDLEGKLEVLGNVEQDVREGYNLFNNIATNGEYNGVTRIVNKDKSITFNGNSLNSWANCKIGEFKGENKKYILSGSPQTPNFNKIFLTVHSSNGADIAQSKNGLIAEFIPETGVIYEVICAIAPNTNLSNINFKPMITTEANKEKPYEPYGASPSPEYSSEIRTVGDNINLLENTAKTTTVNGVTFTVNEDGSVIVNGTATNVSYIDVNTFPFIKNNDYVLSGCPDGGSDNSYKIYCINVASGAGLTNDYGKGGAIRVGTEQTGTIRIRIASGYKADNLIFKPKLEKGTVSTSYSPYGQGSVEIKKQNKNIAPKLKEGKLEKQNTFICNCKKGESFTLSFRGTTTTTDSRLFLRTNTEFTERTDSFIEQEEITLNGTEQKITITSTIDGILYIRTGSGPQIYNFEYLQIEKGKVATEYAEHQEQTKILPIQKPMLEGDYFVKEVDGWKEVHKWGKVILDGIKNKFTLKHSTIQTSTNGFYQLILQGKIKGKNGDTNNGICNYLKYIGKENAAVAAKTTGLWWEGSINSNYASLPFLTLDEANKWLQEKNTEGNPVYIYYKLETPTKLPCTPEQTKILDELDNFQTYKPVTNITTDSIARLRLKYIADTKTYVDNKYNGLAQQILNLAGGNNNV